MRKGYIDYGRQSTWATKFYSAGYNLPGSVGETTILIDSISERSIYRAHEAGRWTTGRVVG